MAPRRGKTAALFQFRQKTLNSTGLDMRKRAASML